MFYLTHKERRALVYIAAGLATVLISLVAAGGASGGLETCLPLQSADTCLYAIR
jgi:hypothetical protein